MLLPRDDSGKAAPSDVPKRRIERWLGRVYQTYLWTDRHYRKTPPTNSKLFWSLRKYSALLKKRADDTSQWYFSAPP